MTLPLGRRSADELVEVWADASCNEVFADPEARATVRRAELCAVSDEVRALYYDYEVLLDLLQVLPEDSARYQEVLAGLTDAGRLLYRGLPDVAGEARAVLRPLLAKRSGDPSLVISAVGHAHLDLAWLWPLREGGRKGTRTFATALANLERYPGFVFAASQPQLYQWVKDDHPDLYERVKRAVGTGRIEPLGALWVEADTNIPSGESLVRQLLLGQRFWRSEFGRTVQVAWLPDSFGFSGALPQILRKGGVRYFTTQKLSWSLVNRFPHHSFVWQGIDGSRVLAHMLPEGDYNSPARPLAARTIETRYRDKAVSSRALMAYGLGDGGGGPGEQHLERLARLRDLQGLSPVVQEGATTFYERWRRDAGRFAVWVGELYLERHQGTLTTQARTKRSNRLMEVGLRELEWAGVLASLQAGYAYPADWLAAAWREVLLYQFHDILPGSSIKRVYEEAAPRYEELLEGLRERLTKADQALAARLDVRDATRPYLVQNSLPWDRRDWLDLGGRWREVHVPAMGYAAADADEDGAAAGTVSVSAEVSAPVVATRSLLENDVLAVRFRKDGAIASLVDKRLGREIVTTGNGANRFAVFVDQGDVWDFSRDYIDQEPRRLGLVDVEPVEQGVRRGLRQTYRLGHSELVQEITLAPGAARLDFVTAVRWREPRSMLRVRFPVTPQAEEATYEIQFGFIRRPTHSNTSWDLARSEVAAQKWVDVSQGDFGVALLNDCKYGHRVKDGVIDLNLLRSVKNITETVPPAAEVSGDEPNPYFTDQGEHRFTYALYPHAGDHVEGRVVQAAYELNVPLRVTPFAPGLAGRAADARAKKGEDPVAAGGAGDLLPPAASLLSVDAADVMVETVKKAEDGDDVIVRLYETDRRGVVARVRFGFPVSAAAEVDLLEEHRAPLDVDDDGVTVVFLPFEIKTLRVTPGRG